MVEIVARGRPLPYTTIQNWSTNVYNLVTKRAVAHEDATDGVGRRQPRLQLTMKYPAVS